MSRTLSDCKHHGHYLPIEDRRCGQDRNPCPLCVAEGILLPHVQAIHEAWMDGGTRAVQNLLGVDSVSAGRRVSNLRRQFPDMFPRKRKKVFPSRRRLMKEAIAILEAMPCSPALNLVLHNLHMAMPPATKERNQ